MKFLIPVASFFVASFILSSNSFAGPAMYGLFMVVKGDVKVTNLQNQTSAVKVGSKVLPGETVTSGADSRAKIVMSDRNVINVSPATKFTIDKYENDAKSGEKNVELNLIDGKIRNNVEQKYDGDKNKFQIKTATAVAGVRGTQFLVSFDAATKLTQVVTLKGAVSFAAISPTGQTGNSVIVKKGETTSLGSGSQQPEPPKALPKEELKQIDSDTNAQTAGKSNGEKSAGRDVASEKPKDSGMLDKTDVAHDSFSPTDLPGGPPIPPPPPKQLDLPKPPEIPLPQPNAGGKTKVILNPVAPK